MVVVHDIDSGLRNSAVGAWRRLRGPAATPCPLCALTRGVRGVNPTWQRHLDALSEPVHTLTRDQFRAVHASSSWRSVDLPVILLQTRSVLELLVSAEEIRASTSVRALMASLDEGLRLHPA